VELKNDQKLKESGVKNDDMLLVVKKKPKPIPTPTFVPQGAPNMDTVDPVVLQNYFKNNPDLMQQLLQSNPPLANAILNDDIEYLRNVLQEQAAIKRQQDAQENMRIQQLNRDPFDPAAQAAIAEEIRLKNVNENMEQAIEYNPEAFGRVIMLYIDCEVNGHSIKAFVDSGAQSTIMSVQCAERCGIMRLVDRRYAGFARGVGTAKIVGRVHVGQIKIGQSFFSSSFTILDQQGTEFLLGLDMLRKHQCCIDLKDNVLRIGEERAPFLAEKDLPLHLRFEAEDAGDANLKNGPTPNRTTTSTTDTRTNNPGPTRHSSGQQIPTNTQPLPAANTQTRMPVTGSNAPFAEETIQKIVALGFTRDQAVSALRMYNGNADLAASYLFQGQMF